MALSHQSKLLRAMARNAATYDKAAQLPQTVGARLLERLQYITLRPKTVVELGSGTQYLQAALHSQFPHAHIISVDWSLPALTQRPGFQSLCADAHKLPFSDHTIALVCAVFMLEWSPNLLSLLQEIKRVLAPEGLFLFATLGPGTLQELRTTWHEQVKTHHVNFFYDMHDIGDMLMKLHFSDPVMDREDFTLLYPRLHDLLQELKHLGSIKTAPHLHPALTGKSIFQKIEKRYPVDPNTHYLPATFEVIYGHAFGPSLASQDKETGITRIPVTQIGRKSKF